MNMARKVIKKQTVTFYEEDQELLAVYVEPQLANARGFYKYTMIKKG